MANRPVFHVIDETPYYEVENVDFQWFSGFSLAQKRRSIASLHENYLLERPGRRVLEVSRKSPDPIGQELSAFNLRYLHDDRELSVEAAFQGSKVFRGGLQFPDIYDMSPHEAKTDQRLRASGPLAGFCLSGQEFPLEPKGFFYNFLYISALARRPDLLAQLSAYDSFTDIEFNPKRSLNSQAEAVAIACALNRSGLLSAALRSKEDFLIVVYG